MNFRDEILEAARGEDIVAVVIGGLEWGVDPREGTVYNALLDWDVAAPMLDYEFNEGFGGAECEPIWVWTSQRVLNVAEYDGSTTVMSVPRHPVTGSPGFS